MIWIGTVFSLFLVAFAVVDIRSRLIPNKLLLIAVATTCYFLSTISIRVLIFGIFGGLVGVTFFGILYFFAPKKIGAGDVKLAGLIGFMTGIPLIFLALPLGMFIGGVASMIMVALKHRGSIPYAPFLCSGAIISLWVGDWLLSRYLGLF